MRFVLFILFVTRLASANVSVSTQIHDIDLGSGKDQPLIFLSSGQVVGLVNKSLLPKLQTAILTKAWFDLKINPEKQIIYAQEISSPLLGIGTKEQLSTGNNLFTPSILKNLEQANIFFYQQRTDSHKDSQCYNRAHVWTYEWRINNNLYSSKVWLFFTRKFIRKYKFEWWFHVSPMIHVVINNEVKERVMDAKYARGPLALKQWTDTFMRDNAPCPVVEKYTDQANYPESGSCFIMKSSMYYYQPVDLEHLEFNEASKSRWVESEVKHAYEEAFHVNL